MSDFRDILGLGKHEPGAAPARRPKPSVQKPEGMSREVFALLHNDGDSMHAPAVPLVPTTAPPDGFKEKEHRLIGWEWRPFENAARTDALRLRHFYVHCTLLRHTAAYCRDFLSSLSAALRTQFLRPH